LSLGDGLIMCQPLCSVQTSSAECVHESEQCTASDELEPMRISLDFDKTASDEEMCVQEEQLDVNFVSSLNTGGCEHAARSS